MWDKKDHDLTTRKHWEDTEVHKSKYFINVLDKWKELETLYFCGQLDIQMKVPFWSYNT